MSFHFNENYIMKSVSSFYYVKTADGVLECKARGIFRKKGIVPVAGDYVVISQEDDSTTITEILPRKNVLVRPPIANLDCLFIVASTTEPSPNLLLLDKLTAIALDKGIEPIIIITKQDLQSDTLLLAHFSGSGISVLAMQDTNALETIKAKMSGNLSAFTGNSGVGKTTLLNLLAPNLQLETAKISQKLGRGKHTTRTVEIYPLLGGLIADTPGFSSLEFEKSGFIEKDNLQYAFPEFQKWIPKCKFTGCAHGKEQGCAVRKAVEDGSISESRYQSYLQMYSEVKEVNSWEHR